MAFQSQTFANSNTPYYGNPADWSKYSTLTSTISFDNTNAKLKAIPTVPDSDTTLTWNNNQLAYVSDIPDLANWAQYPANHDVNIPAPYALKADKAFISSLTVYEQTTENIVSVSTFTASTLTVSQIANLNIVKTNKINNSTITITADNPNIAEAPTFNLISKNGYGGNLSLTSEPGISNLNGGLITLTSNGGSGLAGLNGAIDLVANSGGSGIIGVTTGGRINITANSGSNDVNLTSAIKLSAAGVNIQSGITSPITSVLGYTFVGGNLGVNSCAGIPSIIPNVPGTNYMYGTNGIVLNSNVYTSDVYPYFSGITNPPDLTVNGRTVDIGLGPYNAMVSLNNVKNLSFESAGFRTGGAITGLSSINGLNSGPVGAIQYSDGAGAFQGNSGLLYNGISRITNASGFNFIDINETANANSIAIQSFSNQVNITAGDILGLTSLDRVYITSQSAMVVNIGSSPGLAGQVLTSDGTFTEWQDPSTAFVDSYQIYVAPNGNDTTGTGSQQNPFLTITAAIAARALIINTAEVSIILSSGTYTESFTLLRNTFLVGVPTGEARQPSNIVGTITMSDTTGNISISCLELNGNVVSSGVAVKCINNCNISSTGISINITTGTIFITECRITSTSASTISTTATTTIRDSVLTVLSASVVVSSSASTTIRQCVLLNTSTSASNLPIVRYLGANNATTELTYTKCQYTSAVTDTGGNKCAVQFTNSANTYTSEIAHNIFDCPGSVTGTPSIQCIQKSGAGLVSLSSGDNQVVGPANFIAPAITSTPMYPVLQSRYASFSSSVTQPLVSANVPQIITHNTTELNTGGFALSAGSIQVTKAGNYEVGISIQFNRATGATVTFINFWFRVNGVDVPRSCSQTSMTGNDAEFLATVSIIPSLNAGDIISVMMGGADTNIQCLAVAAATTPLAKPAIPSIITNIKLLL